MVEYGNHHWGVGMFTSSRRAARGRTSGRKTGRTLGHQAYLAWLAFFTDRPLPAVAHAAALDDDYDYVFAGIGREDPPDAV